MPEDAGSSFLASKHHPVPFTELKVQLTMHWLPNIRSTLDRRGSTRLFGQHQCGQLIDNLCEQTTTFAAWHRRLSFQ